MDLEYLAEAAPKQPQQPEAADRIKGFPSPAADFSRLSISLDQHLIRRSATTFFCRAKGSAMQLAGVTEGDILIVDTSLPFTPGRIVVATLFGELVLRRLVEHNAHWWLCAETQDNPPQAIRLNAGCCDHLWGVVAWVIHSV